MSTLIYLIPALFAVGLFIFFRKKVVWWEYLILVFPSMLITLLIHLGMVHYTTSDTEYLGDYVTEIRYYEPWDEYIHRTCYHHVKCGKSSVSIPYDCSYVDRHSAEWKQILSNGYEYSITKEEYNRLHNMWSTSDVFVDMNRHYHSYDGDMYSKKFDGNILHSKTRTLDHDYTNKVKGSYSIFGFSKIDTTEARVKGLYNYPELYTQTKNPGFSENDMNQTPFLGYKPTKDELTKWQFINGYFGPHQQFRVYLLFFYDKSPSVAKDQRSYWEGGNKNEMVLCFGLDKQTKKVEWVDAFSWEDKPAFEVNFRDYYSNNDTLNLSKLADWTMTAVPKYWKRKNFADFDYIQVELSNTQLTWLFIIILLFNIGFSIFIVMNRFEYNDNGEVIDTEDNYTNRYGW